MIKKILVKLDLRVSNKEEFFIAASNLAKESGLVVDAGMFHQSLMTREEEISTGIGKRIAFPHANGVFVLEPFLSFIRLKKAIDFNAIDNQPVDLFFVIGTPINQEQTHLKILSRIARELSFTDLKEKLIQAKTKLEAIDLVNRIFYPYVLIVTEDEKLIAEAIKLYDNSANLKIFKNEDDISLNDIYTADLKLSTELITELTGFSDQLKPNELLWMIKSITD
ncbi:MAG: PTS sugar transporter subunit IIA [Acholeplasmataceae bacterium]|jgi:fructose-specific phosphotransferase system IIA component|nr:PTS sugar transporter subunit IIA [Acholeplasmataceae bacterium]